MLKIILAIAFAFSTTLLWSQRTIKTSIPPPEGYVRLKPDSGSFGDWLQNLPLLPEGSMVKWWNGKAKRSQRHHAAVIDIDFLGGHLQQCADAIIRLRAEYLWQTRQKNRIAFAYTCCRQPIAWSQWREGWRPVLGKRNGRDSFTMKKKAKADASYQQFRRYLKNIMIYAGTLSLSRDLEKIKHTEAGIGDIFVEGGSPGHAVIIVDMAINAEGKKLMLLAQSYTPAESPNILKSGQPGLSPWFEVDFRGKLFTPEWTFKKADARRFK
jgi:hypothetical protein